MLAKEVINATLAELGDCPEKCKVQIEFQRKHYEGLLSKMEQYDWRDILKEGGIKFKEGDNPKEFAALISKVNTVTLFIPMEGDQYSVCVKTMPSLIYLKLQELGMVFGPLGYKLKYTSSGEIKEIDNSIRLVYDEKECRMRLVCI